MTGFFSAANPGVIAPESIGPLILEPLQKTSVAMQVSSVVQSASKDYRFPILESNPLCHWVAEGGQLTPEDPGTDELVVTPKKLTALVKISREMANDSINPGAAALVGASVVSQIQRQLDQAYFGSNVGKPNQPAGLDDLVGYQTVTIGGQFRDLDWSVEAESLLNQVGATATAFVASATTVAILARLKGFQETDTVVSNINMLQADPTQRTKYQVNGTPLHWVPDGVIADGDIWALCSDPANPRAFVVQRQDVELITSPWPYFDSDCIALRAILRYGFAWPQPEAVVKIAGMMPGS